MQNASKEKNNSAQKEIKVGRKGRKERGRPGRKSGEEGRARLSVRNRHQEDQSQEIQKQRLWRTG